MTWIKGITPKQMHDQFGMYQNDIWFQEMDRYWIRKEDRLTVASRLINTKWGKVEHVTIQKKAFSSDGSGNLTWAENQQIKNELFGENRDAIEVFPNEKYLVDVCDVYHLWVFDKKFEMPFGIHPEQHIKAINRGALKLTEEELEKLKEYYDSNKGETQ